MALTPQVLVGETTPTEDITELVEELSWSSTSPGGFASCSFTIPGAGLLRRVNLLREGNVLHVRDGAVSLWEGVVVNHPHPGTFGADDTCTVECGGLLSVAKSRADYCKVWSDADLTQWHERTGTNNRIFFESDNGLYIGIDEGSAVKTNQAAWWYYWIDDGLGVDDIDHLVFSANWALQTGKFEFRVQYATHPWGASGDWTTADFTASGYGASPAADFRDPAAGAYPAGTRALRFQFYSVDGTDPTDDRAVRITDAEVFRATAQKTIDQAMCEVADDTGLATTTSSAAVGSARALVVRPFTTRAGALDELAALHSLPVDWGFWDGGNFDVRPRATTPALMDHYVVQASDPGMTWDVAKLAEGAPDYVCVMRSEISEQTYPQGTVQLTYYPSTPPTDADIHVTTLDFTETAMSNALALAVGEQYMAWAATNSYEGTVTVTNTITRVDGAVVPVSHIRAGQWVECVDILGHEPLYITQAEYDAGSQTATLTIGESLEYRISWDFSGSQIPSVGWHGPQRGPRRR